MSFTVKVTGEKLDPRLSRAVRELEFITRSRGFLPKLEIKTDRGQEYVEFEDVLLSITAILTDIQKELHGNG